MKQSHKEDIRLIKEDHEAERSQLKKRSLHAEAKIDSLEDTIHSRHAQLIKVNKKLEAHKEEATCKIESLNSRLCTTMDNL